MQRRFLVTGGAGFIGSHICDALLAQGDAAVVLDDFRSGRHANLEHLRDKIDVIDADVRSVADHAERIGDVDAVIHLAALISGHDSLYEPDVYEAINIGGLLRLIDYVADRKIPRLIFASSSTVYGNNATEPLTERTLPNPLTVYAVTKLAGEHLLSLYARLHGFSHCSLRLFNVYGPRQAVDHPYANVTCKFSFAAATGTGVRRYGDGEQSRDFVYVSDVVRAFLAVLEGSADSVYNVGTGSDSSINELLKSLERIAGAPLPLEQHPDWPNDIRRIRADISRIADEFGFRPKIGLDEGLAATVRSFRQTP